MTKIIHLSDLHIGYPGCYKKASLLFNELINEMKDPDDHVIVITGDLVNNAFNFLAVRKLKALLARLEKAGFNLLVVPGNHDYGIGAAGFHFFVKRFKRIMFKNTKITYPKTDRVSSVVFFGLDSMAEELSFSDMLFAQGELGNEQLSRLEKLLNEPEFKDCRKVVYLHHHPLDHRPLLQLKDSDNLRRVVENKIDVLLFGHFHEKNPHFFDHDYPGFWGIHRCYNAGTATSKAGMAGRYIMMDLEKPSESDIIRPVSDS